jgi:very-short-patch-repair endonuclease/predicted RNA-binding Zn-ribbon protein involved in translation (DUF1610 family)
MYVILLLLISYIVYRELYIKRRKVNSPEQDFIPTDNSTLPYKKKDYLFSNAEKSFYGVLKLILKDEDFSIFAKVRIGDLLYLPNNTPNRQMYWNKIQSKHVDFVICDNNHVKPILAIELDDSSHSYSYRVDRDLFVNKALHEAGLNIIRVKASNTYNVNEITQLISCYIKPTTIKDEVAAGSSDNENIDKTANESANPIPTCPKCGLQMVERTAKKGDKAGNKFYGCPNYPKCREVVEI